VVLWIAGALLLEAKKMAFETMELQRKLFPYGHPCWECEMSV
jgi:hypothetical protein